MAQLVVDEKRRKVFYGKKSYLLPPAEFAVLQFLKSKNGVVVSTKQIFSNAYRKTGNFTKNDDAAIRQAICRIRKSLGDGIIRTFTKYGYCLES